MNTASDPTQGSSNAAGAAEALLTAARDWIAQDPDPETRDELRQLLDAATELPAEDADSTAAPTGDPAAGAGSPGELAAQAAALDLAERFSGTLQFGTAGLRAELGAGPMRMNRVVVQRAAAGVAAHVLEVTAAATGASAGSAGAGNSGNSADSAVPGDSDETGKPPRAVIGFDARKNSAVFARDTAAVFTAAGIETMIMPRPLPTPVLAWAVREFDAEVGVMVTASHNPAADNGYKVYLGSRAVEESGRGCQIVPPHDAQIAAQIAQVGDVREIPRADDGWTVFPVLIENSYLDAIVPGSTPSRTAPAPGEPTVIDTTPRTDSRDPNAPRIVLTAMHGVGGPTTTEALARAGFTDVHPVREQHTPDPTFPTVAFPNPEEPGALDLAFELARSVHADLVIANDPDADRCAVAVPDADHPAAVDGWRMLRGDEVGVLLGLAALRNLGADAESPVLANSIVSSRLLGRMARTAGVEHRETLTGFKWIARVPGIVFGYEEALGYCTQPDTVRDKDGISAAVAVARLAQQARSQGRSLTDELAELAVEHGLFTTDQLSIRVADLALIPEMMTALRERTPTELAGSRVVEVRDLAAPPAGSPLPPTDGMLLLTEDDTRVIVRPSGTEPKLKCYLEAVTPVTGTDDVPCARNQGMARLQAVVDQLRELFGT